ARPRSGAARAARDGPLSASRGKDVLTGGGGTPSVEALRKPRSPTATLRWPPRWSAPPARPTSKSPRGARCGWPDGDVTPPDRPPGWPPRRAWRGGRGLAKPSQLQAGEDHHPLVGVVLHRGAHALPAHPGVLGAAV